MSDIRYITKSEIPSIIDVHNKSFKNFFLTELGPNFLYAYYDGIRKDIGGILLGYFSDGKLYGFCAASLQSKGYNTTLIKNNIVRFSVVGFRILFSKPSALIRLVKNLSKTQVKAKDDGDYAELFSIATVPEMQGKGIGRKLLIELEQDLKDKGVSKLSLTTDYYRNESTLAFYKKMGYGVLYEFNAYPDRKMYRLIKLL